MNSPLPIKEPAGEGNIERWDGNYFVAAYPPFSTWTSQRARAAVTRLNEPAEFSRSISLGLYVHIPFCSKRCDYCYYYSQAGRSQEEMGEYVDDITNELTLYSRSAFFADRAPSFIYFGGGTPSLLSAPALERLMSNLQAIAPWNHAQEITFECAPKSTTKTKLALLKDFGVTRISLGIQAWDDETLQRNGRSHLIRDIVLALDAIANVRFPIVNLDLMVGLIGETDVSFLQSLDHVMRCKPESLTTYQMEIPRNTPLYHCIQSLGSPDVVAGWNEKRRRLREAFDRMESQGYTLRSAYTGVRSPEYRSFVYQDAQYRGSDLLGLGLSAFSYAGGVHFQNTCDHESYRRLLTSGTFPIDRAYVLNKKEQCLREFILQLKCGRVDCQYFNKKFGIDLKTTYLEPLRLMAEQGWLSIGDATIELSREGLLRVDRLLPSFYRDCHRGVRYS